MNRNRAFPMSERDEIGRIRAAAWDGYHRHRKSPRTDQTCPACKACVSTAMPLCHWPCSCYPNHAMGQVNDWKWWRPSS